MQSLFPLAVYCISLVSLQQLLALPVQERPDAHRLDLLTKLTSQGEDTASEPGSQTPPTDSAAAIVSSPAPRWPPGLQLPQVASGVRAALLNLAWARPSDSPLEKKLLRARRHAHVGSRGGHHHHQAQLMRVGCVLGTCQVQNLSHRLYQLIGQSGREDSSPINPRSPHSYG